MRGGVGGLGRGRSALSSKGGFARRTRRKADRSETSTLGRSISGIRPRPILGIFVVGLTAATAFLMLEVLLLVRVVERMLPEHLSGRANSREVQPHGEKYWLNGKRRLALAITTCGVHATSPSSPNKTTHSQTTNPKPNHTRRHFPKPNHRRDYLSKTQPPPPLLPETQPPPPLLIKTQPPPPLLPKTKPPPPLLPETKPPPPQLPAATGAAAATHASMAVPLPHLLACGTCPSGHYVCSCPSAAPAWSLHACSMCLRLETRTAPSPLDPPPAAVVRAVLSTSDQ